MNQNTEKEKDWASELINHLLTVVEKAQDQLPQGFTLDGMSMQSYSQKKFSITFSFGKEDK